MQRLIIGFNKDDVGDWRAELNCGHQQHTRHNPPFVNRPWVADEAQRQSMIGEALNCKRCDDREFPEHYVAYKKTPEFTEHSIPKGLLNTHNTKAGVWARIVILEGSLAYFIEPPAQQQFELTPQNPGVVVAEQPHHIQAVGPVRFYVEFYRAAQT